MAKLIITADDYGLNEEVNDGIRECIKTGAITSVQILTNLATEKEMQKLMMAIDLAEVKFGKRCGIGLHFNTTEGPALVQNPASSLVARTENGKPVFYTIKTINHDALSMEDVKAEFQKQLEALQTFLNGRQEIDSVSSHHNIHFFSETITKAILEVVADQIPFRSPVQWRSEGQKPDPAKFKKWYEVLPIVKDSTITFQEATQASTKWVLNNAMSTSFLIQQRTRIQEHHHKTPVNCSEQWYGQPSYECLIFIIREMARLQRESGPDPYVSEIYSHIASSEGNHHLDLTYSMPRRVAEYQVWKSYKVKKLLEECHKGFHPVELCSYRDALHETVPVQV